MSNFSKESTSVAAEGTVRTAPEGMEAKALPDSSPGFTKTSHLKTYPAIDPTLPALSAAGKIVVIGGGPTGIGFAAARAFAAAKASHIVLLARRQSKLAEAKANLQREFRGVKVSTWSVSTMDDAQLGKVFAEIRAKVGEPNIMVMSMGATGPYTSTFEIPPDEFWNTYDVNVKGNVNFVRHGLDKRYPKEGKIIISVSTAAAHHFMAGLAAYGSSKQAFLNILTQISDEEMTNGVRCHSFHPGAVLTDMARGCGYDENSPIPWTDPELPGDFTVWLASPEANFLNGRMVWAAWDVEELKSKAEEIESNPSMLRLGLIGA